MSWSVAGRGEPKAVADQIAQQFSVSKCEEPEEGIRLAAAALIAKALASQENAKTVVVSASGSQSRDYSTNKVCNSLSISITPQP
jgi:hypothetical protein